jgi:hypothetical protein
MENTKNTQLTNKQIENRIKYNFFRTLYSGDLNIDTSKFEKRIIEDFKKNNINLNQNQIEDMMYSITNKYKYDIMEWMF